MDVNKWKSIAVDIESYTIIRAMGANGLRNPGNMIKKMVSDTIKKIAKKAVSYTHLTLPTKRIV